MWIARLWFLLYLGKDVHPSLTCCFLFGKQCNGCPWHILTADRSILTMLYCSRDEPYAALCP